MPPNEVKGTNNNSPPFTHSPLKAAQSVRPASWQPAGNAAVWPKSAAGQRWSERRTSGRMDPVQEMDAELKRLREAPVETQTSAGKYQVSVDMSIFKPEDIQLLLSPGLLVLCAEREVPLDECTNVIRRFRRKLSIPEDVQTDAIATHMNGKGILTITVLRRRTSG